MLRKGTAVIDSIGQTGFDPGTEWGTGLTSTADNTLQRKSVICAGDTNTADAFDPSVEWDGFATDTFDGLGSHSANCVSDTAPSVSSTTPANSATDVPLNANIEITFSEAVSVTGSWFGISCTTSGGHTATPSGGPTTFTLDPDVDFVDGDSCTVTVLASQVTDQDSSDPPDNMAADHVFSFSVADICAASYTPLHDIQGNGVSTPIPGAVTTQGIVVGDFEGTTGLQGFYLQGEDAQADADPQTSEGIFVFTGNANLVNAGSLVRVTGYARERFSQTTINGSNNDFVPVAAVNIVVCGSGSVTPANVTMPFATTGEPERFEGMLVHFPRT